MTVLDSQFKAYAELKEDIRLCNTYTRLPTLLDLVDVCTSGIWLKVLGQEWVIFDRVTEYLDELLYYTPFGELAQGGEVPIYEMMDEVEIKAYEALPDEVMIFRGCAIRRIDTASVGPPTNMWQTDSRP